MKTLINICSILILGTTFETYAMNFDSLEQSMATPTLLRKALTKLKNAGKSTEVAKLETKWFDPNVIDEKWIGTKNYCYINYLDELKKDLSSIYEEVRKAELPVTSTSSFVSTPAPLETTPPVSSGIIPPPPPPPLPSMNILKSLSKKSATVTSIADAVRNFNREDLNHKTQNNHAKSNQSNDLIAELSKFRRTSLKNHKEKNKHQRPEQPKEITILDEITGFSRQSLRKINTEKSIEEFSPLSNRTDSAVQDLSLNS